VIGKLLKQQMPHIAAEVVEPRHDEALHLLEARRGRGKSYFLMWFVWTACRLRVPVYLNFTVDTYRLSVQAKMAGFFPSIDAAASWIYANVRRLETWDDLLTAYGGFVLLDEANRLFDSRFRGSTPHVVLEWFQQSRRSRVTVILASQSFDWLDVRIRQLADTLWMVRKVMPKGRKTRRLRGPVLPERFSAYGFDPWAAGLSDDVDRGAGADRRMTIPFRLLLAQCYDTREPIRVLHGVPTWLTYADVYDELVARGHIPAAIAHRVKARLMAEAVAA
jgi:hypothetical protein